MSRARPDVAPRRGLRSSRIPSALNHDFHDGSEARVILDQLDHARRDLLGFEDSTRRTQFGQNLLPESTRQRRVDELRTDRVDADVGLLCQVRE